MNRKLSSVLTGVLLMTLSGVAQAQCENLRVIVRNSVYPINGLEAFCTDFNKMKADLADMRSALRSAREEYAPLKDRLAAASGQQQTASIIRDPAGAEAAR